MSAAGVGSAAAAGAGQDGASVARKRPPPRPLAEAPASAAAEGRMREAPPLPAGALQGDRNAEAPAAPAAPAVQPPAGAAAPGGSAPVSAPAAAGQPAAASAATAAEGGAKPWPLQMLPLQPAPAPAPPPPPPPPPQQQEQQREQQRPWPEPGPEPQASRKEEATAGHARAPAAAAAAAAPAEPVKPAEPAEPAKPAEPPPPPPQQQQQQQQPPPQLVRLAGRHADRMVAFLSTLAEYPFILLLAQEAAAVGAAAHAGVGGGGIDTRQRLQDFAEGEALADLESWCREPVHSSRWREAAARGANFLRLLLLAGVPYDVAQQALTHPWLLQLLGVAPGPTLPAVVEGLMPRARQLLAGGSPHLAVGELRRQVGPGVGRIKASLEGRHRLARGPTPLERLDFLTAISRTSARLFFTWLRALARLCSYLGGMLSVVSGALSFTVVPSIILSVMSAGAGIGQLLLTGAADLLEPPVNGLLALTETGKDKAASFAGTPGSTPVGPRALPPATVEQLEGFFEAQLTQVSGLINRPEIPRLATDGASRALLVKAYDLGLVDALGRPEARAVRELLAASEAQGALRVLLRGGTRAAVAAAGLNVAGVLAAAHEAAQGLGAALAPGFLAGGRASVRRLFRPDGFFAYADERQAQVALVLLCRLLSWLHLASVVSPGNADCLRFVLVLGEAQSGKAELFSRLVAAPQGYAAQLGGSGGGRQPAAEKGGGREPQKAALTPGRSASTGAGAGAQAAVGTQAIDMRPVEGQTNMYCCVLPGLNSRDLEVSRLAHSLAATIGGVASAVVFLVHPATPPSPDKLAPLEVPLAAGRRVLVAVNGPGRVKRLLPPGAASQAAAAGGEGQRRQQQQQQRGQVGEAMLPVLEAGEEAAPGAAPAPAPPTPLEALRQGWQAAAEALCSTRGFPPSLVGVVVSELLDDAAELPPGVHKFAQVHDWVVNTANRSRRLE